MATIRKMRQKWQVLIRRKGSPHITKTFAAYADATTYAQESEDKINKGLFQDLTEAMQTTLGDALVRYRDEVCPTRKWGRPDVSTFSVEIFLSKNLANFECSCFSFIK